MIDMKRLFFWMNVAAVICMIWQICWLYWVDQSEHVYYMWQMIYAIITKIPITVILSYYGYHLRRAMGFANVKILILMVTLVVAQVSRVVFDVFKFWVSSDN